MKGSLGLAGVALALGVFGIFGGGQILCEKGTQVEIGTVKKLQVLENDPSNGIPVLSQILSYFSPKREHQKFILVRSDETVIQVPFSKEVELIKFAGMKVTVTGNYNSCSQSLKITDPRGIEVY